MSDLTLTIQARIEEAQRQLGKLERQVNGLQSPKINFELPTLGETIEGVKKLGSALKLTYDIAKLTPTKLGGVLQDMEEMVMMGVDTSAKVVNAVKIISSANAGNILRGSLDTVNAAAYKVSNTVASIGFEVFGVTQAVQVLNSTFSGFFNDTVGRQIRLNETILRTKTALAATTDVMRNGQRLTDPTQALAALDKPIEQTLASIRRRSLDIAGTTSEAIIGIFQTVATQIGTFGGNLKDAENLAITFSAALGTIGMSDPGMAMQEIRSILQGDITNDSILARTLGITNKDIQKAKQSAGGLVDFLQKRLEPFVAGQAEASKTFAGVTSNIQEIQQGISRAFGAPSLQPLLEFLTDIYKRLSLVYDRMISIADVMGRMTSGAVSGIFGGIMGAQQLRGFSERDQLKLFAAGEKAATQFFVFIQNEIDNLRPELNKITTEVITAVTEVGAGIAQLAAGLGKYKWEEFKVVASNFVTLAKVLNTAVVPAFSSLLKVYGAILQSDIGTMFATVQVTAEALERFGILPLVRLAVLLKIAWVETLRTVAEWFQKTAQAIKDFAAGTLNVLGKVVSTVGGWFATLGTNVVQMTEGLGTKILNLISRIATAVGAMFTSLGRSINSAFPQFTAIGNFLISFGRGLKGIDVYLDALKQDLQDLATRGKASFEELRKAADRTADSVRRLGTTIGTWMAVQLRRLGDAVKGLIMGFIKFQVIMWATDKITSAIVATFGGLVRAQDQLSESNRAMLAADRLVNFYKDVGDSASAAARALRDYNKAIVEGRQANLTTQLGKQSEALQQSIKEQALFQRTGRVDNNPFMNGWKMLRYGMEDWLNNPDYREPYAKFDPTFDPRRANAAMLQRRTEGWRLGQINLNREADALSEKMEVFRLAQSGEDERNQIAIFARERQDIEEMVKQMRKDTEKEIADLRFQTEREVAQIGQQLREAQRAQERADLERTLARQTQGLTSVQSSTAEIINQFQLSLFDAQTEAQRKQFEITEKRIQLDKSIEEYKLATEKQIADIRKRMNDYDKKVVDWKAKKAEEERQRNLKAALYENAVRTEHYVLPQSEKDVNEFRQTVGELQGSPRQALALLKSPGALEAIGATSGMSPRAVAEALFNHPDYGRFLRNAKNQGDAYFMSNLNGRMMMAGHPDGSGKYLFDLASSEVSRGRDFQRPVPNVPELKGFGGFNVGQYAAQRRDIEARLIQAESDFRDAVAALTSAGNLKDAIFRLSEPTQYTGLPSLNELDNSLAEVIDRTNKFSEALAEGRTTLTLEQQGRLSWQTNSRQRLQGAFSSMLRPDSQLTPEGAAAKNKWVESVIRQVLTGDFDPEQDLNLQPGILNDELAKNPKYANELLRAVLRGIYTGLKETLPEQLKRQITLAVAQFREQSLNNILEIGNTLGAEKTQLLSSFVDAAAGDDPRRKRAIQVEFDIAQERAKFMKTELAQQKQAVEIFEQEMEARRRAATNLGEFEATLKQAAEAIGYAKAAAQSLVEGYKGLVKSFLTGGDLKEALESMVRGFLDRILDPILEQAFAPMQEMLEKQIRQVFNIKSPEDVIKDQYTLIMEEQKRIFGELIAPLERNSNALEALYGALTGGAPETLPSGIGGPDLWNSRSKSADSGNYDSAGNPIRIGSTVGGPAYAPRAGKPVSSQTTAISPVVQRAIQSIPVQAFEDAITVPIEDLLPDLSELEDAWLDLDEALGLIKPQVEQASQATGSFFAGLAGLAAGALSVFGGINKMQEGGTQNTLLGLAGVFAGIGSIASGFGTGGAFAGLFRAEGGPVTANRPYITGERGPELFLPGVSGSIIPNSRLPFTGPSAAANDSQSQEASAPGAIPFTLAAGSKPGTYVPFTKSSPEGSRTSVADMPPLRVEYDSVVINEVAYVTADQHRKGMAEAANRGRSLVLEALQNSVKTRRRVGM